MKDGKYYYGSTKDIGNRLRHHNSGKVSSTKKRKLFILHYFEEFSNRKDAELRERFFKSIDGYIWLKQNNKI